MQGNQNIVHILLKHVLLYYLNTLSNTVYNNTTQHELSYTSLQLTT